LNSVYIVLLLSRREVVSDEAAT